MTQAVPVNASNSLLQAGHGPSIRPVSDVLCLLAFISGERQGGTGTRSGWNSVAVIPRGDHAVREVAPFRTRTHYALRMDGTFSIELIELLLDLASQLVCVTSCNRHRQGHS